jgi:hypothetical protein
MDYWTILLPSACQQGAISAAQMSGGTQKSSKKGHKKCSTNFSRGVTIALFAHRSKSRSKSRSASGSASRSRSASPAKSDKSAKSDAAEDAEKKDDEPMDGDSPAVNGADHKDEDED